MNELTGTKTKVLYSAFDINILPVSNAISTSLSVWLSAIWYTEVIRKLR